MAATLISILGPPAVGKTTLAKALAGLLHAEMIHEDYAGNPFLAESYTGDERYRLPAQLTFLLSRVRQLGLATWPDAGRFVSDYAFCMDRVYAENRLAPEDLAAYHAVAARLAPRVHPPEVLVALDAPVNELRRRIGLRGRGYEAAMDETFLAAMRRSYRQLAGQIGCPVVPIDAARVDFRQSAAAGDIADKIRELLA